MKKELYIPACYKYIKKRDGTSDQQRIFSVAKSAFKAKYPDQKLEDNELISFLKTNHVIPEETKAEDLNTEHLELCFTIISQYKCNSICQLCAYSPLFKNQWEVQEFTLIGYTLRSWNNLQALLESGLTCRHFRAMIPVSEKSSVSVIPLNRLAFEYMEKMPKSQSDMLSITEDIIRTLKENNKNKLSTDDFKIAKKYLDNLLLSNYHALPPEKIENILKKCFQLSFRPASRPSIQQEKQADVIGESPLHLEGLLAGKALTTAGNRKPLQETAGKKKTIDCSKGSGQILQEKTSVVNIAEQVTKKKENSKKENISCEKKLQTCYTKDISSVQTKLTPVADMERSPHTWQITSKDLQDFPVISLDMADTCQMRLFLEKLLMTPLLPMEIVTDDKMSARVFLYVQGKFYIYSKSNLTILDTILPYIEKSAFRKIICYEPYQLYEYFYQQQAYGVALFSIRLGMDFACSPALWKCNINTVLHKICKAENPDNAPTVMDSMRNYYKMLQYLNRTGKEKDNRYWEKYYIMKFIGYSYNRKRCFATQKPLFQTETIDGYQFTYTEKDKLMAPYIAVCYRIQWRSKEEFPIEALLSEIMKHRIPETHEILLLSYGKNNMIFCLHPSEYGYLCDLVNNIACHFAELRKKSPVHIDECITSKENKKCGAPP